MTNPSERELEQALNRLSDVAPDTVEGWVQDQLVTHGDDGKRFNFESEFAATSADDEVVAKPSHDGQVCIYQNSNNVGPDIWADESAVPDWIDAENELPVKE
jgi:hypothetical protein